MSNKSYRQLGAEFDGIKQLVKNALDLCGSYVSEVKDFCKARDIDFDSPFCQSAIFQAQQEYRK